MLVKRGFIGVFIQDICGVAAGMVNSVFLYSPFLHMMVAILPNAGVSLNHQEQKEV